MTAKIIPLPSAIITHEWARQLLALSCEKAFQRGLLSTERCVQINASARLLDTFHVRLLCDEVLQRLEAQRNSHAENA